jgi:hypothetical protein
MNDSRDFDRVTPQMILDLARQLNERGPDPTREQPLLNLLVNHYRERGEAEFTSTLMALQAEPFANRQLAFLLVGSAIAALASSDYDARPAWGR